MLYDQAEQALRESNERYRLIVETANEGIWTICLDSTITFVNGRLATMLGYSSSDMLGESLFKFVPPAIRERAAGRLQRAGTGISESSEGAVMHKNGNALPVLIKTSPMRDSTGGCAGMIAMITDWTRQRQVEEALRKSAAEYRQIVESTTDGIIKVDTDAIIEFVNVRDAEMLGYQPHELIGTSLFLLIAPSEQLAVTRSLAARAEGKVASFDTMYVHKDGSEVFVNIAGSALRDEYGQLTGTLGVVRNVTEQKKLRAQLMASDRMASLGTLAAGVAHEINNPLAAILANLDYIQAGLRELAANAAPSTNIEIGSEWLREHIEQPLADVSEAAQRVQVIVRDMKTSSRSSDDDPPVVVKVIDVLESSIRMSRTAVQDRARLVTRFADLPSVHANEARLGQVFINLIVNAAHSIPVGQTDQHEICVSARHAGAWIIVEVTDTGSGIAPENIDRIFDPFFTTKPVGVGTGLGLAICQRIVADMGGTLTVKSVLGAGSTFSVAIPAVIESTRDAAMATPRVGSAGARRVLVVDGDTLVAPDVRRALSAADTVIACTNAWAALALVLEEDFDLILCELMMPDMTGMDLHGELLIVAPEQARKIIFMTGTTLTQAAQNFLDDQGMTQITKPCSAETLRTSADTFRHVALSTV